MICVAIIHNPFSWLPSINDPANGTAATAAIDDEHISHTFLLIPRLIPSVRLNGLRCVLNLSLSTSGDVGMPDALGSYAMAPAKMRHGAIPLASAASVYTQVARNPQSASQGLHNPAH